MSDESKALAQTAEPKEIAEIRKAGQVGQARKKDLQQLYKVVQGREEWGSIRNVTPETQFAVARFCQVAKADPLRHVDILGSRPYLNAEYYEDRMSNHPYFVSLDQVNITDDPEAREKWGVPDDATAAYVTIIVRYLPSAPIEAIKAGRLSYEEAMKWTHPYEECNWAGHKRRAWNKQGKEYDKRDDVGRAEPHKTARTRSLRRCAKRAFSSWSEEVERERRQAVFALDAEWDEDVETAPENESQDSVSLGDGEPAPAYDEPAEPAGPPPEDPEALTDARKRLFATLRTFKLAKGDARKDWMAANGLPDSVTKFRLADFDRADAILLDPIREDVIAMCEAQELNLEQLSQMVLGVPAPDYASHWTRLQKALKERQEPQEEPADDGSDPEFDL